MGEPEQKTIGSDPIQNAPVDGSDPQAPTEPTQESELDLVRRQSNEYLDMLQRLKAEFDNYRKRKDKERIQMADQYRGEVIRDILPVLDALNLAVADTTHDSGSFRRGIELILDNLMTTLTKLGLERLSVTGTPYDPSLAEAVTMVPHAVMPEGTVVEELVAGFRLNGRILRPARVVVSSGLPPSNQTTSTLDVPGGEST